MLKTSGTQYAPLVHGVQEFFPTGTKSTSNIVILYSVLHFANYAHQKTLYTHSLNEHGAQHCSLHSVPHKRQSIPDSATFSSNKISQHNLNSQPTMQIDLALLTVFLHTRQTIHLPCSTATTLVFCEVSFIPTECFIRKKLMFQLLFCSLRQSIHSSVLCMLCIL